jgi:hypothetical protein
MMRQRFIGILVKTLYKYAISIYTHGLPPVSDKTRQLAIIRKINGQ